MSLKKSTVYLKNKTQVLPIYLTKETYRDLVVLSQELGTSLVDLVNLAITKFFTWKNNKYLLEQTKYNEVNPIERVFSDNE